MPAKANTTTTANFENTGYEVTAREVDFVTRFANDWQGLRDLMSIARPIQKAPGTILKAKYAEVTLSTEVVGEGEEVPYSEAQVKEKSYGEIAIDKKSIGVSLEAIEKYGYEAAIQLTDRQFRYQLQSEIMDKFVDFIQTGTLTSSESSFQKALAMAQGRVRNKWKKMKKGITKIIGFCNILDAYAYLGEATLTTQNQFGMTYIENFLGYDKLFLMSEDEIPAGKVIATPSENIVLYSVNPNDSAFARAGLKFTTDGETNLIGFHVDGNYRTMTSESFAIIGMTLFAEYLDGIAVITVTGA